MTQKYYGVYVYGELVSDTYGELTKEEAKEVADEYEREGYDLEDIFIKGETNDNI